MDFMKWFIGGVIGAAIGGAVWIAVGYFLEAEVGYVAWGIGFLAGIGVRIAAGTSDGVMPGIAGVLSAVGIVLLSKYIVISLYVNALMAETPMWQAGEESVIVTIADEVVDEYEAQGKRLNWPAGMSVDEAYEEAHYPREIWQEAKKRWQDIPADEQQQLIEAEEARSKELAQEIAGFAKDEAFKASLSPFDLLWLGLAAFTAFRIGSGANNE